MLLEEKMKRRYRSLNAFIVAIMVAVPTLYGCDASNTDASKLKYASKKPITFTFFQAAQGKDVPETNRVLKKIAEKTGVTIKFEGITGEAKKKIGVMIATGDYPDFIDAGDGTAQMIKAEALLPLENEIPKYPNLQKYLGQEWEKIKNPKDGHIYIIPQFGIVRNKDASTSHNDEAFWIQKAVLKEFNYPKVNTLDEYFDLIRMYKEKYPTINGQPTIGFEILNYDWRSFCLINPPQFLAGYPNDGIGIVDEKTKKITNFADKNIYKQYYKKLNEVYHQDLIDKEAFVETYDEYIAKLSSGRVLGMVDQGWQFIDATSALLKQNMIERTYVPLPITYSKDIPDRYAGRKIVNGASGFSVTKYCKDKERALQFLNDLLSDDLQRLVQWGEKDIDYKIDEKGKVYRTQEQRNKQKNPNYSRENLGLSLIWFPHFDGFFDDGNAYDINEQPDEFYEALSDYDKELLKAYGYKKFTEFLSPAPPNPIYYPMWSMVLPANAPETIAKSQIEELQKKYDVKMITSKPEDADKIWNEYLSELKKVDMKAYEDAMNKELQRRLKEWGSN
jgi:putative aldouronate transport system substrate-binding protein